MCWSGATREPRTLGQLLRRARARVIVGALDAGETARDVGEAFNLCETQVRSIAASARRGTAEGPPDRADA